MIKLTLEYDGTDFVGWQRQREGRSVQAVLEEALQRLTQAAVPVVGAGRTDAGVHAVGQVAHFHTESRLAPERLAAALNALLPSDVAVRRAEEARPGFHARFDARLRVYGYAILQRRPPSALLRRYAYHLHDPIDPDRLRLGLDLLRGTHDFRAFRALGAPTRTTRCTLGHIDLAVRGDLLVLTFGADRFLRHMVRMLVGSLIRLGRGSLKPEDLRVLLEAGGDGSGGPAAPAHGLYLVYVGY